jgi:hypothetical protein
MGLVTRHLFVLFMSCIPASLPATVRYQADINVSRQSGGNAWVGYVPDRDGRLDRAYEFLLEPEYDVLGRLFGWDLLLFRLDHRNENLLEPAGAWHGLQPFSLVARDFASGPSKSAFGDTRTIRVRGTKARVTIRVVDALVASADEFSSVVLHVEFLDQ